MKKLFGILVSLMLIGSMAFAAQMSGGTTAASLSGDFLKLDCSNDPLTSDLAITGKLTTAGTIEPSADDTSDLGTDALEWKDLYVDGVAYVDDLDELVVLSGSASSITQTGSGGYGLNVSRNIAEAGSNPLASIAESNASGTQPTLALGNVGSGPHVTTVTAAEDLEIDPATTGSTNLMGNNGNAAFTQLKLSNDDEQADAETGQTSTLSFQVNETQDSGSTFTLVEAARIECYKTDDFWNASGQAENDAGLKLYTRSNGAAVLALTLEKNASVTWGGTWQLFSSPIDFDIIDNTADAWTIDAGASGVTMMNYDTTNGAEKVTMGVTLEVAGILETAQGTDLASGADLAVPTANYCDVTGTTQTDTMYATNLSAGTFVVLQFDGSVTVKHATSGNGAQFQLAGAGDFSATAGDTLMLVFDSVYWREVSRTAI